MFTIGYRRRGLCDVVEVPQEPGLVERAERDGGGGDVPDDPVGIEQDRPGLLHAAEHGSSQANGGMRAAVVPADEREGDVELCLELAGRVRALGYDDGDTCAAPIQLAVMRRELPHMAFAHSAVRSAHEVEDERMSACQGLPRDGSPAGVPKTQSIEGGAD